MRPIIFEDDLSQLAEINAIRWLNFNAIRLLGSTVDELERWQDRFRSTVVELLGLRPVVCRSI